MTEPVSETPPAHARHAALASPVRLSILAALSSAGSPRDALALSRDLELHVTTVRFHLERLAEAGLVRVEPSTESRRGRPRLLYRATGHENRAERAQTQLIETLAAALAAQESDHGRARSIQAGRRWADTIAPAHREAASSREVLVDVLEDLGFEPAPDDEGIDLQACPFRDAARDNPRVICSVHEGLVQRITERTRPPGHQAPALLPFVSASTCRITGR